MLIYSFSITITKFIFYRNNYKILFLKKEWRTQKIITKKEKKIQIL